MLMKLVSLRTLSSVHSEQVFALRLQDKKLPPLLSEIWDVNEGRGGGGGEGGGELRRPFALKRTATRRPWEAARSALWVVIRQQMVRVVQSVQEHEAVGVVAQIHKYDRLDKDASMRKVAGIKFPGRVTNVSAG
ncbi:Oxysterols receptor LXR-beta [Liparis tanakae]|uniref:Oxysterols receptor LXR-beta n=1 Tax=Liparis tanakae TaxID=230148 RepID=A0A4Z2FU16_9TELE|nr:Oxysterols receptor LXR-beta [Liparis tanakae]